MQAQFIWCLFLGIQSCHWFIPLPLTHSLFAQLPNFLKCPAQTQHSTGLLYQLERHYLQSCELFYNCCWCEIQEGITLQTSQSQTQKHSHWPLRLQHMCFLFCSKTYSASCKVCTSNFLSSNACNKPSSCRTRRSLACFGKMDGDSFGFII